ncbi:hypothetical protein BOX15_Mlig029755g1, partial [Macrostomum lignano]
DFSSQDSQQQKPSKESMLKRFRSLLGGQSKPLGFLVVQPVGNNSSTDGQPQQQQHVVRVPSPNDPEDYEVRLSFDLAECKLQPLNVVGLAEEDNTQLLIYLMPQRQASDGSDDQPAPQKVYEAPAHNPEEPLAYEVGREYLLCLRHPSSSKPVALLSVLPQAQNVASTELGLLPYWSMKWFERDFKSSTDQPEA